MGNGETRNLACPYSTYPGKGRRDGVWTGNRGVTKASPASGSTKAQEGTARLGVKEGVKPEVWCDCLGRVRGISRHIESGLPCVIPRIHVYGFSKAEDPEYDFHERINLTLGENVTDVEMHRVRLVAPGKWMLCASFTLPESVASTKPNFIAC
uniref:Uncharacterized protein n=1 Tax=Oryza brachyantha TaxID=4533 RepID=J3L068_ORYBR